MTIGSYFGNVLRLVGVGVFVDEEVVYLFYEPL
jgi:hypothetical protein